MPGNTRRRYTTTPEQDRAISQEAARRKLSDQEVFRAVVDAGFEAYFTESDPDAELEADRVLAAIEGLERTVRACGKASVAQASWSAFAELDLLRRIMGGVGLDPDDESVASRAMARFLCEADCNVPTRIWESAGRRMVAGAGYNEALKGACRENGVPWPDFSGQPESELAGDGEERADNHGRKKNRRGKRR